MTGDEAKFRQLQEAHEHLIKFDASKSYSNVNQGNRTSQPKYTGYQTYEEYKDLIKRQYERQRAAGKASRT